jgi:hypothetical protein
VWAIPEGSGGWLLKLTLDRDKPYTVGDFAVPRDGASLAIRRGIKMFRSSANFAWSLRMSTGVVVRTQWAIGAETMDCAGAQVMRQLYELGYPVVATRVTQHDRAFVRLSLKGPCEQPSLRIAAASPAEDPYFFDKTYRDADTAAIVQELVDDPRWVPATKQAERVARKGGGAVAPMAYPSIEWVRTICDNERRSCL